MDDMLETMYEAPGIGLAAPQVGVLKRVIVVDSPEGREPQPLCMANPELIWVSDEDAATRRAACPCPSTTPRWSGRRDQGPLPGPENEIRELEAEGLLATCIQHEMDHLDGILFVDHISRAQAQHDPAQAAQGQEGRQAPDRLGRARDGSPETGAVALKVPAPPERAP